MEEEEYESQIQYFKRMYPDKKLLIEGFGLTSIDTVSNYKDILGIIKTYNIKCTYCNEPIKEDDWIVVFHNPKEEYKSINVLFFCHSKKCALEWCKKKKKEIIE